MHFYDVHAYCTSTVQSERLRSCTWSTKCYNRVYNNRKDTNTATRTFSQLKQSQFMCGPLFEFLEASSRGFQKPLNPLAYAHAYDYLIVFDHST